MITRLSQANAKRPAIIAVPDIGVARKRISGPDGKVIMIMDMTMKSTTKQAYEILTSALLKKAGTAAK